MNWITDTIAIGNYLDAQDQDMLVREGVQSILGLDGKLRGRTPADCGVAALTVFDLKDGPGNDPGIFRHAVRAVQTLSRQHPKLLVHCHAGRSRSVIVVAAHLMQLHRWTPAQAIRHIAERREIEVSRGLEQLLSECSL